jgi:hypothetical protein
MCVCVCVLNTHWRVSPALLCHGTHARPRRPSAFCLAPGGGGHEGYEDDGEEGGEEDADGLEDAAAAAVRAHKGGGKRGGRQPGSAADEESTLAAPEQLRQKRFDATFAVDPLFHTMSALFDQGGAKGACTCLVGGWVGGGRGGCRRGWLAAADAVRRCWCTCVQAAPVET